MSFNNEVKSLQEALNIALQQSFLPDDYKRKALISGCKNFLELNGHVVQEKSSFYGVVINNKQLISYYYNKLKNFSDIMPLTDLKKDALIAKSFIGRLSTDYDLNYAQALALGVEIIEVLFSRIDEFNFTNKVYASFSIFGQDHMRWITDKAISIINGDEYRENKLVESAHNSANEYLRLHSDLDLSFDSLETLANIS